LLNVWANEEIISISCARSLPLTEGFLRVYAALILIERFFFPPERSNSSPQRTKGQGSIPKIATRFGVGTAFVKKMLRQGRSTGDLAPLAHGGSKPPSLTQRQRQFLKRRVRQLGFYNQMLAY
jgi:hypothetical protein